MTAKTSQSNLNASLIWLILVTLTLASLAVDATGLTGKKAMLLLLLIAMIKSQLVAQYFMALRHTRKLWQGIMLTYFVVVGGLIAWAYLISVA